MTPEGEVVRAVLDYLAAIGVYAWRSNTGRRGKVSYGKVGSSDIMGIMPDGRFLAIECKAATGKPTAEQLRFLAEVDFRGGVSGVARSIEDAARIISEAR